MVTDFHGRGETSDRRNLEVGWKLVTGIRLDVTDVFSLSPNSFQRQNWLTEENQTIQWPFRPSKMIYKMNQLVKLCLTGHRQAGNSNVTSSVYPASLLASTSPLHDMPISDTSTQQQAWQKLELNLESSRHLESRHSSRLTKTSKHQRSKQKILHNCNAFWLSPLNCTVALIPSLVLAD